MSASVETGNVTYMYQCYHSVNNFKNRDKKEGETITLPECYMVKAGTKKNFFYLSYGTNNDINI